MSYRLQFLFLLSSENQSAVVRAHNPVLHALAKHMELDLFVGMKRSSAGNSLCITILVKKR
jgi:hypothetical protein